MAKEQKFNALTGIEYKSQGNFWVVLVASTGRVLSILASSPTASCHTRSLLSLPCLQQLSINALSVAKVELEDTYVMIRSGPQDPNPRMALL